MKGYQSYLILFSCWVLMFSLIIFSDLTYGAVIGVPADQPTIQAGIDEAAPGDTVLVAYGTYTGVGNKNLDFEGKAITVQCQTGPEPCIIDCEGDGRGFHFHTGEGNDSVLSGFSVINGYADPSGAGILITNSSSPTIDNCVIRGNSAGMFGGGVICSDSSPIFSNCTISDNNAGLWGGGMFLGSSSLTITNCDIIGNSARDRGGGIYSVDSSPRIINSVISKNSVPRDGIANGGGAIYFAGTGWLSYPVLTNCVITGNLADNGGGIRIYGQGTYPTITNCTIALNTAETQGGGITGANSATNIVNSIIWANAPDAVVGSLDANVIYCTITGGWSGAGNNSLGPLFIDLTNEDYRLRDNSPCIGSGTSEGAPSTDIDGTPRPSPFGSNPDIGAYESNLDEPEGIPFDIFALEFGNTWAYEGTRQGEPLLVQREITRIDQGTFSLPTYVFEIQENGIFVGTESYEHTSQQIKLWGSTVKYMGAFYDLKFSEGPIVAEFPAEVGDYRYSVTTVEIIQYPSYVFNASVSMRVMSKESVALHFDTFEAYEVRYVIHVWGPYLDYTETFTWWMVPYIGVIKDQGADYMVELTSFVIGGGPITHESDADSDGLKDYQELIVYNTNWQAADTDHDGCEDAQEVLVGRNPNLPDSHGDVNMDCAVDLQDAIISLHVVASIQISPTISLEADVNGDAKIGIKEAIYILQRVSDIRP